MGLVCVGLYYLLRSVFFLSSLVTGIIYLAQSHAKDPKGPLFNDISIGLVTGL